MPRFTARQSEPPGPPPAFSENRIPQGAEEAHKQREQLLTDHARMKPAEPPTISGNELRASVPPVNARGLPAAPPRNMSPWPQTRWHPTKAASGVLITSEEHERSMCKGEGWSNKPIPAVVAPSVDIRLELLESLMDLLASHAEEGETAEQTLARIISERDSFARKLAKEQ